MNKAMYEAFLEAYERCGPSQDNEGQVLDRGSFKAGFCAGFKACAEMAAHIADKDREDSEQRANSLSGEEHRRWQVAAATAAVIRSRIQELAESEDALAEIERIEQVK